MTDADDAVEELKGAIEGTCSFCGCKSDALQAYADRAIEAVRAGALKAYEHIALLKCVKCRNMFSQISCLSFLSCPSCRIEVVRREENEAAAKAAWEDGETIIPDDIPQNQWDGYTSGREDAAKDVRARISKEDSDGR